jgi:hypothetical protein
MAIYYDERELKFALINNFRVAASTCFARPGEAGALVWAVWFAVFVSCFAADGTDC